MLGLNITASRSQVATYFFCVCLFSISFLVFLNSAVSFVITERIGQKHNVGDAVGTLGFADELLALVACPLWGALSDYVGVRTVVVSGYTIVGLALVLFVQAKNVYPQLLLARLFFALGGSATATMVTAILPILTEQIRDTQDKPVSRHNLSADCDRHLSPDLSSEPAIIPTTNTALTLQTLPPPDSSTSSSRIAGFVGMFTGLGALIALFGFLPLPRHFSEAGFDRSEAIAQSFYVVGGVAIIAAALCFVGLRNIPSEENKNVKDLFKFWSPDKATTHGNIQKSPSQPYFRGLLQAVTLGWTDVDVGLAYVGGFVARASSVGISLFIPLFVNAFFISSGECPAHPGGNHPDPGEVKKHCQRAYIVSSILTGVSQLVALACAPLFGYWTSQYRRLNIPLLIGAGAGVAGYTSFGLIKTPDPRSREGKTELYFIVALIGISQISAIVCSLALLSRGIQRELGAPVISNHGVNSHSELSEEGEEAPLLRSTLNPSNMANRNATPRSQLKGSIAGIYSFAGGAGILILTKVGGLLFDQTDPGSPFFIMAGFNGLLLAAGAFSALLNVIRVERLYDSVCEAEET